MINKKVAKRIYRDKKKAQAASKSQKYRVVKAFTKEIVFYRVTVWKYFEQLPRNHQNSSKG